MGASDFTTKDSGERQEFESGVKRDTEAGKPRFDLMVPEGVPFEDQLLTRFAALMARGAEKYDARNWEQANGREEIARARSSAFRHFFQWFCGETDEDHAAATLFNIMVIETITPRVEAAEARANADWPGIFTGLDLTSIEELAPEDRAGEIKARLAEEPDHEAAARYAFWAEKKRAELEREAAKLNGTVPRENLGGLMG